MLGIQSEEAGLAVEVGDAPFGGPMRLMIPGGFERMISLEKVPHALADGHVGRPVRRLQQEAKGMLPCKAQASLCLPRVLSPMHFDTVSTGFG
jgi:hypothetical protein